MTSQRIGVHAEHEHYRWWALSCTSLGMLMATINSGTLIIALPDLERSLHTGILALVWVILAYMIASTVLVLTAGRLSDLFGRKRAYVGGFLVFAFASLGAGFAGGGTELLLWRILQGVGGAFLFANAPRSSPTRSRASSSAWRWGPTRWSRRSASCSARCSAARWSPSPGNGCSGSTSARAAGAFRARASQRARQAGLEPRPRPARDRDLRRWADGPGLGVSRGGVDGWDDPVVIVGLIAAAILLPLFVEIERRGRAPMLDLEIFRNRLFAAASGAAFINGLSRFALLFVFVFYFQGAQGDDPITAGIKLAPMALGMLVASPLAGAWADRYGSRTLSALGMLVSAAALGAMTMLDVHTPYWQSTLWLALVGIGSGMFNSPNTAAMMGAVPAYRRGIAAGARMMLQNTGAVISIAFVMAIITAAVPKDVLLAIFSGVTTGLSRPGSSRSSRTCTPHCGCSRRPPSPGRSCRCCDRPRRARWRSRWPPRPSRGL